MRPLSLLALTFLLTAGLVVAGLPFTAHAQPAQSDEEKRLQEIERQLQQNTKNASAINRETPQKERELSGLRTRLIETAQSLRKAEGRTTDIEQRLSTLEKEVTKATADLNRQRYAISDILAALQSLEMSRPPALAVSPSDAAQAARAAMALSATVPDLQARVDLLQETVSRLAGLQTSLDAERNALTTAREELNVRSNLFEETLVKKQRDYDKATAQVARLTAENKRLANEATSIREVLNNLQAREAPKPIVLASPAYNLQPRIKPAPLNRPTTGLSPLSQTIPSETSTSPTTASKNLALYKNLPSRFSAAKGLLPYPVSGKLRAKYGSKTLDGSKLEGLQIETRGGAIVTAPFGGEVAFAENLGRLGNVFILDVGENYHLVMVGFARLDALVGQKIQAGEPVGKMPSDNPREELYFEVRHNREPQNPNKWLLSQTAG